MKCAKISSRASLNLALSRTISSSSPTKPGWEVSSSPYNIAEAGSLFIIYTTKEEAQKTVIGMYGRTYNQRPLKVIFINEGTYLRSYVPLKLKQPPEGEEF